eukprot:COSAG06_NODE_848_length_11971_cov_10.199882_1_plen_115_part_00
MDTTENPSFAAASRLTGDERKSLCSSRPRTEHVRATAQAVALQCSYLSCPPSQSRCAELAPHYSYGPGHPGQQRPGHLWAAAGLICPRLRALLSIDMDLRNFALPPPTVAARLF